MLVGHGALASALARQRGGARRPSCQSMCRPRWAAGLAGAWPREKRAPADRVMFGRGRVVVCRDVDYKKAGARQVLIIVAKFLILIARFLMMNSERDDGKLL
ncbi:MULTISPECIES: hypothetical protein [Cupriavidus]|uniref:hypothetical protein n=1 Tax=Cupriavidus sp. DF5525 TaxID=3160989 RepID=UPI0003B0C7CA|nr:hypothetical protein N234_25425 [Ralstonia pickettii DTP0602]